MNRVLKIIWNLIFNFSGLDISFSARYGDWSFYLIELRANYAAVEKLLEGKHLTPREVSHGETRVQIVGCDMRKVQVAGPYREVSIQVPVEPLEKSPNPKYTHLFLPVDTERSRWPGTDIWGFPKFLARIDIKKEDNTILCRLAEGDRLILEFTMKDRAGSQQYYKWDYYGMRKLQIVKSTMDPEGLISEDGSGGNAGFALGKHPLAGTLGEILISNEVVRTVIGHNVRSILKKPVRIKFPGDPKSPAPPE